MYIKTAILTSCSHLILDTQAAFEHSDPTTKTSQTPGQQLHSSSLDISSLFKMQSLLLLAILPLVLAAPAPVPAWKAPLIMPRGSEIIPGKYIVKMKDGVDAAKVDEALTLVGGDAAAEHVFKKNQFKGFSGAIDDATIEALQALEDVSFHLDFLCSFFDAGMGGRPLGNYADPPEQVEYIEHDAVYKINAYVSQTGATWGLGRISHRAQDSTTYVYDSTAGANTCSYVIDTGIYTAHAVS